MIHHLCKDSLFYIRDIFSEYSHTLFQTAFFTVKTIILILTQVIIWNIKLKAMVVALTAEGRW